MFEILYRNIDISPRPRLDVDIGEPGIELVPIPIQS
jgi:hypothetical protein